MTEIKSFILEHKRATIAAGCAVVVLLGFLAAVLVNRQIGNVGVEEIPSVTSRDTGVFGDDITVHNSDNGPVVIDLAADTGDDVPLSPMKLVSDPDTIWNDSTYAGNHTLVEQVKQKDGAVGVLTVDKLGLSVNVFDSGDESMMADMSKGIAHFPSTSAWDGCVGVSAHNVNFDGSDGYFKYLYTLSKGDTVRYSTKLGQRAYVVESVVTISASDWTPLYHTDHNQIVMITCISGQPNNRICVTAVEQAG